MNEQITITRNAHGVLISIPIAVNDLVRLTKVYGKEFDIVDGLISEKLGGFAMTTKEGRRKWRAELGIEAGEDGE